MLLPHPGHEEVPSAGELEAIDEAHLRNGRDRDDGHENRRPRTAGASRSGAGPRPAWLQPPLSACRRASPLPLEA